MISNRLYAGQVEHKGNVYKGEHEGIISVEMWEKCHEIVQRQAPYPRGEKIGKTMAPLRGVLRCGHCHGAMKPTFTVKGQKRYYYYECDQDTKRGKKICPVGRIASDAIEETVRKQVQEIFDTEYFREKIALATGVTGKELEELLKTRFWEVAGREELNMLYRNLFSSITVTDQQIEFEVRTAGLQRLMEGIRQ